LRLGSVDGDRSEHEDGETAWLLVYVSRGLSSGEESHESFFAHLSGPLFRLGLHHPEGLLRVLVGDELFHEVVELHDPGNVRIGHAGPACDEIKSM
jgi:hypothetical protein